MNRRAKARIHEVEREVAIRNGIHAVDAEALEAELFGYDLAHQWQGRARERTRAQRHVVSRGISVPKSLGVAQQRLRVREQVVSDCDRLRALKVGISGHRPGGVLARLGGQGIDSSAYGADHLARSGPAVEAEVERHLVVARPTRVQGGARRRDLGQSPFDDGVDVLVRVEEYELSGIELAFDAAQTSLDGGQLRRRQEPGGCKPARMGDAPGDVVWIQLEVNLERRREAIELGQQPATEATTPELAVYGVSLFMSPSSPFSSRAWSWPWTCDAVRTPIPQSLMKPAAADWSNVSPLPYVARERW